MDRLNGGAGSGIRQKWLCSEGGDATVGEKHLCAGERDSEISARAPVTDTAETTEDEAPAAARSEVPSKGVEIRKGGE